MSTGFIVTINNQMVYECNDTRQPARLRRHLDEIDNKLSQGIQLGDSWVDTPNDLQKQQYTAMILIDSLDKNKEDLVNIMSVYLCKRYPALKEIRASRTDDQFTFTLIE